MNEIIKDKIKEILRTQKVSKYDLALDIGISHATLYNFLSGIDISQKCLNKLAHFVRTYVTPEQKIEAYRLDAIEYEAEIKELKAENEQLKKEKEINLQRANALNRELNQLQTCLQDIKEIADENKDTAQYGGICKSILMIITKAEEE